MIYDGDCDFCVRWIERWRKLTGDAVTYSPSRESAAQFPEIAPERFSEAVQFIEVNGRVSSGGEAAVRSLSTRKGWILWAYEKVPGAARLSEAFYRFIARRRGSCAVSG